MKRISLLVLLVACGGSKDDGTAGGTDTDTDTDTGPTTSNIDTGTSAVGGDYTFVTYNAGLAVGFVPAADVREPEISAALAGLDADVICLQEVWLPTQVDAIAGATSSAFPHQYFPAASQSSDAQCNPGELDSLLTCMDDAGCSDLCIDQVDDCLFDNCGVQFLLLPKDCMRCGMANVGSAPSDIADTCQDAPVEYAYGGSFGTGILSKHPIVSTDELVFTSTTNRRSALKAVIDTPDGDVAVTCTHLTAVFDTTPYPRDSGDWESEQAVQVAELIDWVDNDATEHKVLMGDMNTGPEVGEINAEAPDNWDIFDDADFDIPYLDDDPTCTYCAENGLLAGSADNDDDRIIDHVMFRGWSAYPANARVLDQELPGTESCGDTFDPGALSDHYGVSTTATW